MAAMRHGIRLTTSVLLALLLLVPLRAAISFDNATGATSSAGASSLTFAHTTGASLTDSVIVTGFTYYEPVVNGVSASTVTYAGNGLTKIRRDNNGTAQATSECWVGLAPTSGSNNVVITLNKALTSPAVISAGAITLQGVNQSVTIDANTGGTVTGTHTAHSNNITTVADNAWVVDVLGYAGVTPGFSADGSQVSRWTQTSGGGAGTAAASTLGPITPAGSTAVGWHFNSTGSATVHSLCSLAPSGGAGATATAGGLTTKGAGTP